MANCDSGKKRYRSKKQAVSALHAMKAARGGDNNLVERPEHVYACRQEGCGGWHFTGKEPR